MVNSTCYEVSFRIESKKLYLKKGSKTGYVENRQRKKILTLFTLNNFLMSIVGLITETVLNENNI